MASKRPDTRKSGELSDSQLDKVSGGLESSKAASLAAFTGSADTSTDFVVSLDRVKVRGKGRTPGEAPAETSADAATDSPADTSNSSTPTDGGR